MKALIELFRGLVDNDDTEEEDTRRVNDIPEFRNLLDDDDKENIKKYGRCVLPMLVFL